MKVKIYDSDSSIENYDTNCDRKSNRIVKRNLEFTTPAKNQTSLQNDQAIVEINKLREEVKLLSKSIQKLSDEKDKDKNKNKYLNFKVMLYL